MRVGKLIAGVLGLTAVAAPSTSWSLNLIANGSFEAPTVTDHNGGWQLYTGLPNWDVPGSYVELQSNGLYGPGSVAADGTQWVELDSPANVAQILQSLDTLPGVSYNVNFWYASRPGYGEQTLGVYWNNSLMETVGGSGSVTGLHWTNYSFDFIATGATSTLGFGSLGNYVGYNDAGGNLVDHVVVTGGAPVPEPSTLLLLTAGAGIAARRRRARG